MKIPRRLLLLATSLSLVVTCADIAEAARKYYPLSTPSVTPAAPQSTISAPVIHTSPRRAARRDPLKTSLDAHRYYEALLQVDQRLKKSPNNQDLRLLRAQILRYNQNFSDSASEFQKIISQTKSKTLRAKALNGLGATQFDQAQQADQSGDTERYNGLVRDAETSFKKAIQLMPSLAEAWIGLTQTALSEGRLEDADTSIKKALEYAPGNLLALLTKTQVLLAKGNNQEAFTLASSLKQKYPNDGRSYLLLGEALLRLEKYDDSIIHLKRFLEHIPNDPRALQLLGEVYDRKMMPDDAERALYQAVAINPRDSESIHALLKLYAQQNDMRQAVMFLQTTLNRLNDSEDQGVNMQNLKLQIQNETMTALEAMGRWDRVYEYAITALESLPENLSETSLPGTSQIDALVTHFAESSYFTGIGWLDRDLFLKHPTTQKVLVYLRAQLKQNPGDLQRILDLAMISPLEAPSLPVANQRTPQGILFAIKISLLQGDHASHTNLVQQYIAAQQSKPEALLAGVTELALFGDDSAAQEIYKHLATQPNSHAMRETKTMLEERKVLMGRKVKNLEMLPSRFPLEEWKALALEALQISRTNPDVHALIAHRMDREKLHAAALAHQQLAGLYFTNPQEKQTWERRAAKTLQRIDTPSTTQNPPGKFVESLKTEAAKFRRILDNLNTRP